MKRPVTNLPSLLDTILPEWKQSRGEERNAYVEAALEQHRHDGLSLMLRARFVAVCVAAALILFLYPDWQAVYYMLILAVVGVNGWIQQQLNRRGLSRLLTFLVAVDFILVFTAVFIPNPLTTGSPPYSTLYDFEAFHYFYVLLAAGTLAYSWRTIMAIGNWVLLFWLLAVGAIAIWGNNPAPASTPSKSTGAPEVRIGNVTKDNYLEIDRRIEQGVVFMIVAFILSITVRRYSRISHSMAAAERARVNLSRYFSPNVVDLLAENDEPLQEIRSQHIAVLFVDIVGFTSYAAQRSPEEIILSLREFHAKMEAAIFDHSGTLDKYLGDGLMATFGTPSATRHDATNALACVHAMVRSVEFLNEDRLRRGQVPINASFGLHFGEVVVGDIGEKRLEYAVIGDTVNIASRLEALTRENSCIAVMSDRLRTQILIEDTSNKLIQGWDKKSDQTVVGVSSPITVWVFGKR